MNEQLSAFDCRVDYSIKKKVLIFSQTISHISHENNIFKDYIIHRINPSMKNKQYLHS
jgi:hypothetical protein